jgi:predicted nucleic acid-binding protein
VHYLDTSYLLKIYVQEQGSREVDAWMVGRSHFVCAHHGRLELFAGLKRHQREGRLDARGLRQIFAQIDADEKSQLVEWLPVTSGLIDTVCRKVADLPGSVFLRAADALHLACAADAGLKEIYSHDRHLLAAASHFGLRGIDVIKSP